MATHLRPLAIASTALALLCPVGLIAQQASMPVAEEFASLHFRSIGPATMSGRVADLAVYEANPAIYYVGTAHGGVWKTTSNGATFTPLFQNEGLISIGDVTISQTNPDLVWVGAGESNNRQSTSYGGGIWKSTDGGETFQHMGLANSRHINRIVIHPTNNDIVLVAATGPLFGSGGDRGIYKTTDGGRTWNKTLNVDEWTGANDLVQSTLDPNILYASTYQRLRTTCCMNGGGPGSGIWKSTDGGDTWIRLTVGLPTGDVGRIGLDVYRGSSNIVYATVEASGGGGRGGGGGGRGGGGGGGGGAGGAGAAPTGPQEPSTGVFRTDDGGVTWKQVSSTNPRPMYFSQMRVDPASPDRIYMGGVGLHMSIDGGETIITDAAQATHDDVHAIWINPSNPNHVLIGNDGGLAVTYDMASTWTFLPNLPVGLFYHVAYDNEYPYNVCGGMQDNYNWCGPSQVRQNRGIMNYDWFQIQGGDGFVAIPDLRDSRIIYTESQDGNITRRNKVTGESKGIRPNAGNVVNLEDGAGGFRFHWDTPLMFSPNDPGILLAAANRVFRSDDRGDSWTVISPDLTKSEDRNDIVTMGKPGSEITVARHDGISQWPAIVTLSESPRQPGVYYAGTDDGNVSMSRDGGRNWSNITANLPGFPGGHAYISEVVASRFDAATVYVTVDNHRENDYNPYIWVSNDFGATFRSIVGNLRGETARSITEDTKNADVLYLSTETGIFLTLDRGRSWRRLQGDNFPTVRVDELTIHPRENALLVASHGRALWIMDNLSPIQEYTAAQQAGGDASLFSIPPALMMKRLDNRNDEFWGHQFFAGENPPSDAVIQFHLKRPVTGALALRISDGTRVIRTMDIPANRNAAGVQTVCWDMRVQPVEAPDFGTPAIVPGGGGGAGGRGAAGRGGAGAGGRGGAGGGAFAGRGGGGGGRGGRGGIPGVPSGQPQSGYEPTNICGGGGGGGGGGGRGGGGGGGGSAGPQVLPGNYSVALTIDGRVVDTKPMRIVLDPMVQLSDAQHRRWFEMAMELHELQRRAAAPAAALEALAPQLADIAGRIDSMSNVPANVKTQFASFNTAFEDLAPKLGAGGGGGAGAGGRGGRGGGGGGGRGGRGGGGNAANVLGRAGSVKGDIQGAWEMPSNYIVQQYNEVRAELPRVIGEATSFIARATTMSQTLARYNITLTVPTLPR